MLLEEARRRFSVWGLRVGLVSGFSNYRVLSRSSKRCGNRCGIFLLQAGLVVEGRVPFADLLEPSTFS